MAILFNDIPEDGTTVIWALVQPNLDNPPNVISGVVVKKVWTKNKQQVTINTGNAEDAMSVSLYSVDSDKCFSTQEGAKIALQNARNALVAQLDAEIASL